jgi:hypothetical protein
MYCCCCGGKWRGGGDELRRVKERFVLPSGDEEMRRNGKRGF